MMWLQAILVIILIIIFSAIGSTILIYVMVDSEQSTEIVESEEKSLKSLSMDDSYK